MDELWTLDRCREVREHVKALREEHGRSCQTCSDGGSDDCQMLSLWTKAVNGYEAMIQVAEFMDGLEGADDGTQG